MQFNTSFKEDQTETIRDDTIREGLTTQQNEEQTGEEQEKSIHTLLNSYDRTFLHQAAFQYFNQGARVMLNLAVQDLFKTHYAMEPGQLQSLLATIQIPWSCKIIFGFISDNVAIAGSKRKSYLFIGSVLQVVSMALMTIYAYDNIYLAVVCTFLTTLSIAFADVIVDSLMVIQSRKDPIDGSATLSTFTWTC